MLTMYEVSTPTTNHIYLSELSLKVIKIYTTVALRLDSVPVWRGEGRAFLLEDFHIRDGRGRVFSCGAGQPPARFSFLENSRDFFLIFTSRSRSRAIWVSLSTLEKEWKEFIFHFSLLEKSESYLNFTLFSREKRVKSGTGYDLTSLYLPKLYFFKILLYLFCFISWIY